VGHCEVRDDAKDYAAVPVDALRALKEALNVFAVHRKFVGEIAVDDEIGERRAFRIKDERN
jgi:hypothetical protein